MYTPTRNNLLQTVALQNLWPYAHTLSSASVTTVMHAVEGYECCSCQQLCGYFCVLAIRGPLLIAVVQVVGLPVCSIGHNLACVVLMLCIGWQHSIRSCLSMALVLLLLVFMRLPQKPTCGE